MGSAVNSIAAAWLGLMMKSASYQGWSRMFVTLTSKMPDHVSLATGTREGETVTAALVS